MTTLTIKQLNPILIFVIATLLTACDRGALSLTKHTVLVCEIQKPLRDFATPFQDTYGEGHRITITISEDQRNLTVGSVLSGSTEVLTRADISSFGQEITDPYFRRYSLERMDPVPYASEYNLDVVSGQLYHEAKAGGKLMSMFFAVCSKASGTLLD